MRRFKLDIVVALVAFFIGIVSGPAGRQAARDAATFVREQFHGNRANNLFPC